MKKLGLKKRLVRYLEKDGGWVHSGTLQELTEKYTDQMPRTAVRRLQEAVNEGLIEVRYSKGSSLYRAVTSPTEPHTARYEPRMVNGELVAVRV